MTKYKVKVTPQQENRFLDTTQLADALEELTGDCYMILRENEYSNELQVFVTMSNSGSYRLVVPGYDIIQTFDTDGREIAEKIIDLNNSCDILGFDFFTNVNVSIKVSIE